MRVFFTGGGTGGHLYPALAIARALLKRFPDVGIHFVGASRGIERDVLPTTGFSHTLLDLHPLYRSAPWRNYKTIAGLAGGMSRVAAVAREERPALVVATGGYASTATLAWALTRRVPYVIQEQNSFPGRTVSLFSRWAREIYLGFPEAAASLSRRAASRAIDTGNPVEPPPGSGTRLSRQDARRSWDLSPDVTFIVLAFGGSQGSARLNALVEGWIAAGLPPRVGLIWSTGKAHFSRYASLASHRVAIRPFIAPISEAYAASDVAIARAGAMTTAELCAWGIPMFLIPLPTAAADHQTANARVLEQAGAASWVAESKATPAVIDGFVRKLSSDSDLHERSVQAALSRARPGASALIAERIAQLIGLAS